MQKNDITPFQVLMFLMILFLLLISSVYLNSGKTVGMDVIEVKQSDLLEEKIPWN